MLTVHTMTLPEMTEVYARVARDFPPIEYPPLRKMKRHFENDAVRGHVYAAGALHAAYAFMLVGRDAPRVMLFLYAVEPGLRGQGVGSEFLEALFALYAQRCGLYAEVEKVELAPDDGERAVRLRRIAFYEKLGFVRVEHLAYSIYGVPMHLYYKPLSRPDIPDAPQAVRDAAALYQTLLTPQELHNLDARALEA